MAARWGFIFEGRNTTKAEITWLGPKLTLPHSMQGGVGGGVHGYNPVPGGGWYCGADVSDVVAEGEDGCDVG